jgi:hypothetical protein
VLFPVPLILVPLAGGSRALVIAMIFLAEFGSGIGVMILDITGGSINAAIVPSRLRARVQGAYTIVNYGVRPLGSLPRGWPQASSGSTPRSGSPPSGARSARSGSCPHRCPI